MKRYIIAFVVFVCVSLGILRLLYWDSFNFADRIMPTIAVGVGVMIMLVSSRRKDSWKDQGVELIGRGDEQEQ